VIKLADWVVDLGPEAGDAGGEIVAMGRPEEVVRIPASHTGRFLAPLLGDGVPAPESDAPVEKRGRGGRVRAGR
jgi:excinuclease ABC subunit A